MQGPYSIRLQDILISYRWIGQSTHVSGELEGMVNAPDSRARSELVQAWINKQMHDWSRCIANKKWIFNIIPAPAFMVYHLNKARTHTHTHGAYSERDSTDRELLMRHRVCYPAAKHYHDAVSDQYNYLHSLLNASLSYRLVQRCRGQSEDQIIHEFSNS